MTGLIIWMEVKIFNIPYSKLPFYSCYLSVPNTDANSSSKQGGRNYQPDSGCDDILKAIVQRARITHVVLTICLLIG